MNLLYVLIVTSVVSGRQEIKIYEQLTRNQCTVAASFIINYEDNVKSAICAKDGQDA